MSSAVSCSSPKPQTWRLAQVIWTAMPRSFDLSVASPASVEQVHATFADEEYWLARLEAFGGVGRLDSLIAGDDGAVTVAITQDLRHDLMPGPVAKIYPGDLKVAHEETWRPIGGGQMRGKVNIAAKGFPGSAVGAALVAPAKANGSHLEFVATVEFKIPLVGGKIEGIVGRQVIEQIAAIQRFTTGWITQHG
jgi:hypothetical protein